MNDKSESFERESKIKERRRALPWLLGGLVLLALGVLVFQQLFGLWASELPDTATDTLLLYTLSTLNFAAFIVFSFIFVRNLLKLRSERRARILGSKIKTRLVVYFIAVSLLPITTMAVFSFFFLNRSLEKWFSRLPEDIVNETRRARTEAERLDVNEHRELVARLDRILAGSETYEQLRAEQRRVRLQGLSILGLITLMLMFAATWVAIHLARGIAQPIRVLAEASDEIARGNLSHRVEVLADDEFALLAASFNEMTKQIGENRRRIEAGAEALREKNLALEERRNYIETVLESLSTGVISVDECDRIRAINAAAIQMLQLETSPRAGTPLAEIVCPEDAIILQRVLRHARLRGRATEQTSLARTASPESGMLPVALTATASPQMGKGESKGGVLVIEDLSELLAAQRAAAWSEVARRMAHEIKNPLTPIQLSAERIARHFNKMGNGHDLSANGTHVKTIEEERMSRIVNDCTQTITREVAGLKAMVDEFSRFARLPSARPAAADLNEIVIQAVQLYEDRLDGVRLETQLAPTLPAALLDAEQIRRVCVNLIDNALEALSSVEGERRITVATGHDRARASLLLEIADTGHGIARADLHRLFQPYFSTRGRGLGLAIVERIIADHGGKIRAEQNRPRGAKFMIELPIA
jgi:two-component system, NtrC family, nitrogen regulation sensor histidine kinase NtrY